MLPRRLSVLTTGAAWILRAPSVLPPRLYLQTLPNWAPFLYRPVAGHPDLAVTSDFRVRSQCTSHPDSMCEVPSVTTQGPHEGRTWVAWESEAFPLCLTLKGRDPFTAHLRLLPSGLVFDS